MKVLVIGPSPMLRGRLVRLVAGLPQADLVVASGRGERASYLSRLGPDLVILELPSSGGGLGPTLARLRRIRRHHGRSCVIVVLTNAVTEQHQRRCLESGADLFLDTSLDLERLPALLRSRSRRRSWARIPDALEAARLSR